ncbi:IS3 family transposase ISBxe1 [Paraburkholderia caffeinitolerans]|uniref:IS3 family transposase ISBxe1 n=1 Tax=Paraburkholderia caffeinitolerans TaxID=1723730 RepID=A0A6J5FRS5_9BURK|nr:IS3 family transposase ISBxe1 [Paraburkholderia caffeinitolerans]
MARPRRCISNDALPVHIKAVHAESKGEYGWPRVWKKLLVRGNRVSKDRVQWLMKLHGIKAKTKRRFKTTTDSNHNLPAAPSLLQRDFAPARPDQAWSTDITDIWTDEGWLYLTVILDLFSRQVVSGSMQQHMRTELVSDALRMAWFRRRPEAGLTVHSDRGSQYAVMTSRTCLRARACEARCNSSRTGTPPRTNGWHNLRSVKGSEIRGQRHCD